jgi:hypothetical protein
MDQPDMPFYTEAFGAVLGEILNPRCPRCCRRTGSLHICSTAPTLSPYWRARILAQAAAGQPRPSIRGITITAQNLQPMPLALRHQLGPHATPMWFWKPLDLDPHDRQVIPIIPWGEQLVWLYTIPKAPSVLHAIN